MRVKMVAILTAAAMIAIPCAFAGGRRSGPHGPGYGYHYRGFGCYGVRLAGDIVRLVNVSVGSPQCVPFYSVSRPMLYGPPVPVTVPVAAPVPVPMPEYIPQPIEIRYRPVPVCAVGGSIETYRPLYVYIR